MLEEMAIALGASLITGGIFWWGAIRYFQGQYTQWKSSVDEKISELTRRHERHVDKDEEEHKALAVLTSQFAHSAKDIQDLRDYKHLTIIPYIGSHDTLKIRVDRMERYLNGKFEQYRRNVGSEYPDKG